MNSTSTTTAANPSGRVTDSSGAESAEWTVTDAHDHYAVGAWGQGYFSINDSGRATVRPTGDPSVEVDLMEVIDGLGERGVYTPVLLRFSDILEHRINAIKAAFDGAMQENDYHGEFLAAYPVKVNQQRHVVEEVFEFGARHRFGLEAGSKPELLAVLGMTADEPERIIICNGFKDDKYIEAIILARKLGRTVIPVVEKFSELELIIKYAERYEVRPIIGARVKLAASGIGRWAQSAGVRSKFGLFVSEVLEMFERLKARGMEDCLQLLHCHIGSQIHEIRNFKNAINELGHVYVELARLGAGLKYLDVGGGLGVDYDGSQSSVESSMNYTLVEYARDIVYRVMSVCDEGEIPHPTIVAECGRAMVAYHSVLIFDVLGSSGFDRFSVPANLDPENTGEEEIPQPIYDLFDALNEVSPTRLVSCYHDAIQARDEAMNLFNLGYMSLTLRSLAERIFWATCAKIRDEARRLEEVPEQIRDLEHVLSDTYFCNFSLFQSMPDSWALDQLFPVMPIHRLDEEPTRQAVLADITCDSDGKVDRFVGRPEPTSTLSLHPLKRGETYYLGVFLVGAYQETLGDLHNLFGDTHAAHIRMDDEGDWYIDEIVEGDTAREVLGYVQYDVDRLYRSMRRECEGAVRSRRMAPSETRVLLQFYESGLNGYTYLEGDE
ncbi:MAG: biosynthetic arginine decarboxylase [Phycisphaerales bacterium]